MTTEAEARFLAAAIAEGGQPVAAGAPPLRDPSMAWQIPVASPSPYAFGGPVSSSLAAHRMNLDPRQFGIDLASGYGALALNATVAAEAFAVRGGASSFQQSFISYYLLRAWQDLEKEVDLEELARQLAMLRQGLKAEVNTAEGAVALGQVASAEIAASKGNGPWVLFHLQGAGVVALEAAHKLGLLLASQATRAALRLHEPRQDVAVNGP